VKRFLTASLLSVIATLVFATPSFIWNGFPSEQVWMWSKFTAILGPFWALTYIKVAWIFGGPTEGRIYYCSVLPALIAVILQAAATVVFSFYDGGAFVSMKPSGWVTLVAGIIAILTLFGSPALIAKGMKLKQNFPTSHRSQRGADAPRG
tara:strand:- start:381 stop:830 length:450 start_codon:yes stop_codon:yes gene_type:complete